ncbi:MAG: pentapeptide repeat-containing protein [Bacteroidota bacterium]
MKTIATRFRELASQLAASKEIELLGFHLFPPLAPSSFHRLEEDHQLLIPRAVRRFYEQTNGLQLHWRFRRSDSPQQHSTMAPHPWKMIFPNKMVADGRIVILPLEKLLAQNWENRIYFDWMKDEPSIRVQEQFCDLYAFSRRIRPFDFFGDGYDMAFHIGQQGEWQVLMGEDYHHSYQCSRLTDFESYLEFLLAAKGHVASRIHFYQDEQGLTKTPLQTLVDYWTVENSFRMEQVPLENTFQMAGRMGRSTADIKSSLLLQRSHRTVPVKPEEWESIVEAHRRFLSSGGAGGQWQSLLINGLVIGLYEGAVGRSGEQAQLEHRRLLPSVDCSKVALPYANFCGLEARRVDFSQSDFSHCLFTDARLERANFEGSLLRQSDFSRADLRGVNFRKADLRAADFENCDLRGADFRDACLEGARFPGAQLESIIR